MTKITKLEQKTFNNKPSGFTIGFDDGRVGNMDEKQSDKGLRVGDGVIVTEIPYTSKAGKTSTLYGARLNQQNFTPTPQDKPPLQNQQPPTSQQSGKATLPATSLSGAKANATIKAMSFMIDCFIADKITWDQIQAKHKELTGYLNDAIDECNS
jgi:hypothetical protein